jgi:hypothetical protein
MIYLLIPKQTQEVKNQIDAVDKESAINYFSALLHLKPDILLKLYIIRQINKNNHYKQAG